MGFISALGASLALLHAIHPSLAVYLRPAKSNRAALTEVDDILSRYRTSSPTGQCLKFMHIPKTGGTTIDSIGLSYPKSERPYRSYMEIVYDEVAKHEFWMTAGELFDYSHRELVGYSAWMMMHMLYYPLWATPNGLGCTTHTPPMEGSQSRAYFSDGCTNFCVVREPLERFLSTFKFDLPLLGMQRRGLQCSPESFDEYARSTKAQFDNERYYGMLCHFTPQVQMVYGAESKEASTHQFCQRILRQEHLNEEFDALMKEFGRDDVHMNNTRMFTSAGEECDLQVDDIWQSTKDLVYDIYRADYDAFNYTHP